MSHGRLIAFYKVAAAELIAAVVDSTEAQEELLKGLMAETLLLAAHMHRAGGGSDGSFVEMAKASISLIHTNGAVHQ